MTSIISEQVSAGQKVPVEDGVALTSKINCNSCHTFLPEDAKFCMQCGAKTTMPEASSRSSVRSVSAKAEQHPEQKQIRRLKRRSPTSEVAGDDAIAAPKRNGAVATPKQNGAAAVLNSTGATTNPTESVTNAVSPPKSTSDDSEVTSVPPKKPDPRTNMFGSRGRGLYTVEPAPTPNDPAAPRSANSESGTDVNASGHAKIESAPLAEAADLDQMLSGSSTIDDSSIATQSEMLESMLAPTSALRPQNEQVSAPRTTPGHEASKELSSRESGSRSKFSATVDSAVDDSDVIPLMRSPDAEAARVPPKVPQSAAVRSPTHRRAPHPTTADGAMKAQHVNAPAAAAPPLARTSAASPAADSESSPAHSAQVPRPLPQNPAAAAIQPMMQSAVAPLMQPVMVPMMPSVTAVDEQPKTKAPSTVTKLPEPPKPTTADSSPGEPPTDDVSTTSVEDRGSAADDTPADGDETDGKTSLQKKRAANVQRFLESVELTHASLLKKQEPIPQELPRLLVKAVRKLESFSSDKTDDILKQLRVIAETHSPSAIETLREFAQQTNTNIRITCADGLGGIEHVRSSAALLGFLTDMSTEVLTAAVRGLLNLGQPEVLTPLLWLAVADVRGLTAIRDAITLLDDDVRERWVAPLQNVLKTDNNPQHMAVALRLLWEIRGSDLVRMYIGLTSHAVAEVRMAAMEAVMQTEQKQTVRCLNRGMRDPSPGVRCVAATGLAKINSPRSASLLVAALKDDEASVRRSAAKTMTTFDGYEFAEGASKALNSETDPDVIEYLLEIVARCGTDDALAKLQQYLDSDDVVLCHRAINTLRRLKSTRGVAMLSALLDAEDNETRQLAVEAVGYPAAQSVAPVLRKLLGEDSHEQVRAAAARSLGQIRDADSLTALEEALHDGYCVRVQAVIAMGQIGNKSVVPALLAQLQDSAPEVRYHACNSLKHIGDLPNADPLRNLLDDRDAMVRRGAEAALMKLGHPFRKAYLANRLKTFSSRLLPNTVAGALPGGTTVMIGFVAVAFASASYFAWSRAAFSSEPDFLVSDVRAIAVSNDGTRMTVSRKFSVLEVWDLKSGELTSQFQTDTGGDGLVFRQNGNTLVLAGARSFELDVEAATAGGREALTSAELTNVSCHRIARTPDQKNALLCAATGSATLVDLTSGRKLLTFQIKDFSANDAIAISPDAAAGFVGTASGFLRMISLKDGKAMGRFDIGKMIDLPGVGLTALAIDHSGTFIAVGTSSGNVVVLDTNEMTVAGKPFSGKGSIVAVNFIDRSNQLSVVTRRSELAICSADFASSTVLSTSLSESPEQVAFSGDGTVAAFAFSESDRFAVVDLVGDTVLASHPQRP